MSSRHRWGISRNGVWHRLVGAAGTRTLCRRAKGAVLREGTPHPLDRFCSLCEAGHSVRKAPRPLHLHQFERAEAWAVASALNRLFPWFRQTSRDLARMTALFMAQHHRRLPGDPGYDRYVQAVEGEILRRLRKSGRQEPVLTAAERRWRIRQAAPRPRQRTRREAAEALPGLGAWLHGLHCPDCGRLPDECPCAAEL